jgi:hypothetical protein
MIDRALKAVWRWLTGGGFASLAEAYSIKRDSALERDRIEADLIKAKIDAEIEGARQAAEIRKASIGFFEMRLLSFVIAAPFALHAGAVGLDTIFGFGWAIAAYPPPFDEWEGAILLSFFGVYGVGRGASAIAAAIVSRKSGAPDFRSSGPISESRVFPTSRFSEGPTSGTPDVGETSEIARRG